MRVSELKASALPEFIKNSVPLKCEICDCELLLSETMTKLVCSNKMCKTILAEKITHFISVLGMEKAIGGTGTLEDRVNNLVYSSDDISYNAFIKKLNISEELPLSVIANATMCMHMRNDMIPKVFEGYKTFTTFYEDYEQIVETSEWLQEKLYGIVVETAPSEIIYIQAELLKYKEELCKLDEICTMIDVKPYIVCAERGGTGYKYKDMYIIYTDHITEFTDWYVTNELDTLRYQKAKQNLHTKIISEEEFVCSI